MNWLNSLLPDLLVLLSYAAKVTIVLTLTWIIAGFLRGWSAAEKHSLWATGVLCSLMLPLFTTLIPVRFSTSIGGVPAQVVRPARATPKHGLNSMPTAISVPAPHFSLTNIVLFIWLAGLLLVALKLFVGLARLMRMAARSKIVLDVDWIRMVTGLSESFGVRRSVRILECSSRDAMPLTWGTFHPRIILPVCASGWSEERRRIVIAHELSHIARQDWFIQMCAELLACFYWFHPLVWIAAGKLRQESEMACDASALNSGIPASAYAHELLDLAQTLQSSSRRWSTALAMTPTSNIEKRFMAMFTTSTSRSSTSKRTQKITIAVAACLLLTLAVVRVPAQNQSSEFRSMPAGWVLAGSAPGNYETGTDRQVDDQGLSSAYLKSNSRAGEGFGTLMQSFTAEKYLGKRVRLTASMKAQDVIEWAGLWMRVDIGVRTAGFDNMANRPIKGSLGWRNYEVVLDVPAHATSINFGVLLCNSGVVWLKGIKFEIVGTDVPSTGVRSPPRSYQDGPTNLNFEQ
jgi:beta-lactamase regulating signal transducer with metallopeptidase domain